ncbi:PIF1-like helicase [Hirsutella rhossiliensis]|uniref:ATP-dependent DNA helicase n=1 Tax=Hirsutella rhossiliensis TaxID=111463 RepID=A0A9P8SGK2_9HYPO|nr:PIF1-like helicase domain-containing protein [Hirsutella rhossiliensis]KAH0962148.1 PIF1-like helicase domain-containing protein [Hirsutella rhossiliensis]
MFPDELKGLTPVEEKLISLNSCYGHVRGHITVFPNNVQELATKVLPPLLQALDEIHISWQGAEKPAPSDLSSLLSIEIDAAEMESWETRYTGADGARCAAHGTRHGRGGPVEIEELFALLNQGQEAGGQGEGHGPNGEGAVRDGSDACPDQNVPAINEVTSSGMFALDGPPDVADVEKLQFACDAVAGVRGVATVVVSHTSGFRGGEFTDSFEASFFARTFPTLFPFGVGGPRLVEETMVDAGKVTANLRGRAVEAWAEIVLRRHGGRFALHHIFAFLVFNMGVRSRNRRSLIVGYGVPAIWFTINPNDITNPVKLRLAAYRTRDPDAAEEFLEGLGDAYKRARLAISDPMSSAVFFHREMKLFFDHYVKVGEDSMLADIHGEDQAAYRERIVRYIDSVFSEAPWRLVDKTALTADGVLQIRRTHSMVNRWNEAIAVGLRHNHDISFIATQRKTMALIYYVTNYATKVEDPVWKRVAAAAELLAASTGNRTRQFLMRVANRVFTERPLSQVEVVAHLLGYPAEFTDSSAWAYLNCSLLYWKSFGDGGISEKPVALRLWMASWMTPGELLKGLCLYDYISIVRLKRIGNDESWAAWEMSFEDGWAPGRRWVQVLRRPGKHATVCLDGYLSKDFTYDDESCYRRAAVQHLALFVPWSPSWAKEQLLRRSAEDAKRDAKQWAASSGDGDPTVAHVEEGGAGEAGAESAATYQPNSIGDATRLIDVVRGAVGANQVTAKSPELMAMIQQLCRFQQSALRSTAELEATALIERGEAVKHARAGIFRGRTTAAGSGQGYQVAAGAGMDVQFGPSTSFLAAGKVLATRLTLNKRQSIAFLIICRQLDLMQQTDGAMPASCASSSAERFIHGQSRMDWQEKDVLVIDEVSMLGARTLHAVNERLRRLRGSRQDFGGIPIVLFCGDFQQFRPVQERSIVLPSAAISWDVDNSFKAEQRHQHDKAHALWKRFTTVVMLDEQMRAAGDPELQRLLKRIRLGVQDRTDLNLLNSRNRWNLNMEASLAFRVQQRSTMRIFISEHKWKEELPTEEEAIMILNQGDDSAIPVPAVFMFVAGMPIVVNHNTHQGLKLVNGASYSAVEVIVDKAYRGIGSRPI